MRFIRVYPEEFDQPSGYDGTDNNTALLYWLLINVIGKIYNKLSLFSNRIIRDRMDLLDPSFAWTIYIKGSGICNWL